MLRITVLACSLVLSSIVAAQNDGDKELEAGTGSLIETNLNACFTKFRESRVIVPACNDAYAMVLSEKYPIYLNTTDSAKVDKIRTLSHEFKTYLKDNESDLEIGSLAYFEDLVAKASMSSGVEELKEK